MSQRVTRPLLALLSCSTVLLAGCVTKAPPEPEEIRAQALGNINLDRQWKSGTPATGAVLDNWLATFGDTQLDTLVHEALAANPDLGMAAYRNSCILREITGREVYPVERSIAFQQFGPPPGTARQGAGRGVVRETTGVPA